MRARISVIGDFELSVDGFDVKIPAQKTKALLAWLACHPRQPQPRDRLASLFWADRSTANAKASLRQAVAGIRRALPAECLITIGEELSLNLDTVTCDLDDFRSWRTRDELVALRNAIHHYDGDLLDGFNARSEVFEEWLVFEREALRREALNALNHLMSLERAAGELSGAIATGGRLLALDPLQEAVHRDVMELYAELGQLGSAQRQFRLCRDALAKELQAPPSPETLELLKSLGNSVSSSGPSPTAKTAPTPAPEGTSIPGEAPAVDRRAALPSIAVLPFRTMSSVTEHEYLADGMTEELINLLANSANWRVASRNISFHYRDKHVDVRTVGDELNVGYAVEGSIRYLGDRARISAALVSTADGTQIWSDRYDRPLDDLFDVQDEVAHAIFRTLKNQLGFAERERVRRTPKTNLDAWGLLIKAMQVNVVDPKSHVEQLDLVREAIEIEPGYPRAHAYLASLLFTAVGRGTSPNAKQDAAQAAQHMETALDGGPNDTVVLGMCAGGMAAVGQAQHALSLAERVFELSGAPDPVLVAVLMWNGRLDEAQRHCEDIISALPPGLLSPPGELRPVALLGNLHMLQGNLSKALELTQQDQKANPGNFFTHVNVANLQGLLGNYEAAHAAWQLAVSIVPALTVRLFRKGYARVFVDSTLGDKFSAGLIAAGLDKESDTNTA